MKRKRPSKPASRPRRRAPGRRKDDATLRRARTLLRESEEKFSKLFESSPAKIAIGTMDGKLVNVNRAYAEFFGYSRAEMVGKSIAELDIVAEQELQRLLKRGQAPGAAMRDVEVSMRARDGRVLSVLMSADVITLDGVPHRVATLVDVTERKKLEEHLGQVQKMDSIGRLAGGVAHDFNNILTAIRAYARFVLDALPEGDEKRDDLKVILDASDRAARLTTQLLAFSRRQILVPQVLDLNLAVARTGKMLERLIGENVKLETLLAGEPCWVKVDLGQIEQVLVNLAINARDAMPAGGSFAFETRIGQPDAGFAERHPHLPRGPVVCLSALDTGSGMTEDVRARVFEPFFTTKDSGKGTGLGLSMVYGIVRQSGGDVEIESAPGQGTTVRIYLPWVGAPAPALEGSTAEKVSAALLQGNEIVLLVEDEDAVRSSTERILSAGGYHVLSACDGREALDLLTRHGRPVDALIADVVMPGMSGRELAREIAKRRMARRTLFVSGYTEDAIARDGVLEAGLAFLKKPFTRESLLLKLREVLDGPADRARA